MQPVLVNIMQIKCKACLLNGIILPCTTSVPGLGLQFVFRTSQVKLTWQNYIPMVKWHVQKFVPNSMYATYTIWQYEVCILRYVRLLTC